AEAQRDVATSLNKLGNVQVAGGDLSGARKSYEESLAIDRRLAAANPSNAEAQRDVAVSLWKLASLPNSSVRWLEVAEAMRRMHERGVLAPPDLPMLEEAEKRARQE